MGCADGAARWLEGCNAGEGGSEGFSPRGKVRSKGQDESLPPADPPIEDAKDPWLSVLVLGENSCEVPRDCSLISRRLVVNSASKVREKIVRVDASKPGVEPAVEGTGTAPSLFFREGAFSSPPIND
jgi:hypothetical protein